MFDKNKNILNSERFSGKSNLHTSIESKPAETHIKLLRYLRAGNQDVFSTINRNFFHYKSRELRQVLKSLRKIQHNPSSLEALLELEIAIKTWETKHPKEVEKRGKILTGLKAELLSLKKRLTTSLYNQKTTSEQ